MSIKLKSIHFKNEYLGKPSWACLSHRSLEGRTRVQQIIIGYFVAPISVLLIYPVLRTKSYTSNNYRKGWSLSTQIIMNRERLVSIKYRLLQLFPDRSPDSGFDSGFCVGLSFRSRLALPITWALRH